MVLFGIDNTVMYIWEFCEGTVHEVCKDCRKSMSAPLAGPKTSAIIRQPVRFGSLGWKLENRRKIAVWSRASKGGINLFEEDELEQIKLRKARAMVDAAKKDQATVSWRAVVLTDESFSAAVRTNEVLVVDFWAPWCSPCRMVGPLIEQLAAEYAGRVAFGKMNVDENRIVPNGFGIMSIPTIMVFHHGRAVERITGAFPKMHIEAVFKRYLSAD